MGRGQTATAAPSAIRRLRRKLARWYRVNGRRDLPWRRRPTPYRVLVAEVMLQQTPAGRVALKYPIFLRRFPSLRSLARARPAEVLEAWSGLGYNRRALLLLACARRVVEEHGGRLPDSYEALRRLPGLGPYTAHAVNIFGRNRNEVAVDTNVRRVLVHELRLPVGIGERALAAVATQARPRGRSRAWHSALMDYGALVATSRRTGLRPRGGRPAKFAGSDRYYRGRVVRLLVERRALSLKTLRTSLRLPALRLRRIINVLVRENMVRRDGERLHLPA